MSDLELGQYGSERNVEYKGEHYVVRDNGAVYRQHRSSRRRSKLDETWTFGRRERSGYMYIGSHQVHRIVALAFVGEPPSKSHVVDHINAIKSNNRVENLRWVSRLENVLRHPSAREDVIRAYGSIAQFVKDPSKPSMTDPAMEWLKVITSEEAERAWETVQSWAIRDGRQPGSALTSRIYGVRPETSPIHRPLPDRPSLTPNAMQRNWRTPTEFPNCPTRVGSDTLAEYARKLVPGAVFAKDKYKTTTVVEAAESGLVLSVWGEFSGDNQIKPWAVTKVTVEEGKFVHENVGSFFSFDGAKKVHCHLVGIPFSGESIDDYS